MCICAAVPVDWQAASKGLACNPGPGDKDQEHGFVAEDVCGRIRAERAAPLWVQR